MLGHYLFYIVLVRVGVPNLLRVDHGDGPLAAAVHAAGLVHPDAAGARELEFLHPLLGVVPQLVGPVVLATGGAVGALVGAKEDMVLVIGHGGRERFSGHPFYARGPITAYHGPMARPFPEFPLAEADKCVKCALCLPHCPTYRVTLDEGESPRGRIALMQGLATGALEASPRLEAHLDHCLGCRACEAVCPAEVPYGKLIDATRLELRRRGHGERLGVRLFAFVMRHGF